MAIPVLREKPLIHLIEYSANNVTSISAFWSHYCDYMVPSSKKSSAYFVNPGVFQDLGVAKSAGIEV